MTLTDVSSVDCPHCGAPIDIVVDRTEGPRQRWSIDCETCCRPIQVTVRWGDRWGAAVTVDPEG